MRFKQILIGTGLLTAFYAISGFVACAILMPGYMFLKIVLGII